MYQRFLPVFCSSSFNSKSLKSMQLATLSVNGGMTMMTTMIWRHKRGRTASENSDSTRRILIRVQRAVPARSAADQLASCPSYPAAFACRSWRYPASNDHRRDQNNGQTTQQSERRRWRSSVDVVHELVDCATLIDCSIAVAGTCRSLFSSMLRSLGSATGPQCYFSRNIVPQ